MTNNIKSYLKSIRQSVTFSNKNETYKNEKRSKINPRRDLQKKMNTKRSNISRLESFTYNSSPNISTLMAYAQATGHQLKVEFV